MSLTSFRQFINNLRFGTDLDWINSVKPCYTLQGAVTTAWNADGSGDPVYFGNIGRAPNKTEGYSRIYIPKAGIIKAASVWTWIFTTFGSNEAWPINIRLTHNAVSSSHLIQSKSITPFVREITWSNNDMNVAVAYNDYFEIEMDNPAFGTPPTGMYSSAVVYIETS